jgi:hypothetical protein
MNLSYTEVHTNRTKFLNVRVKFNLHHYVNYAPVFTKFEIIWGFSTQNFFNFGQKYVNYGRNLLTRLRKE